MGVRPKKEGAICGLQSVHVPPPSSHRLRCALACWLAGMGQGEPELDGRNGRQVPFFHRHRSVSDHRCPNKHHVDVVERASAGGNRGSPGSPVLVFGPGGTLRESEQNPENASESHGLTDSFFPQRGRSSGRFGAILGWRRSTSAAAGAGGLVVEDVERSCDISRTTSHVEVTWLVSPKGPLQTLRDLYWTPGPFHSESHGLGVVSFVPSGSGSWAPQAL